MKPQKRHLLAAIFWLSCTGWSNASPPVISGEVTTEGRPLADAEVRLLPVLAASAPDGHGGQVIAAAHSQNDGRFAFTLPEPGPWAVEVAAPGHLTMRTVVEVFAGSVRLSAIELPPARRVDLRLTAGERPVPKATVVWPAGAPPALPHFGDWQPATILAHSNENGSVTLPVAVEEPGEIDVSCLGFTPLRLTAPDAASTLELSPAAGPEMAAPDSGTPPLTGRIVDAVTDLPLPSARVWTRPPARVVLARTGADGLFTLPRGDGPPPHSLGAAAANHHAVLVTVDAEKPLEIALEPRWRGVGWVVDDEERPVEGAEVRLESEPGEAERRMLGPWHTDPDGRYEVAEPPLGRYRLSVRAEGFGRVTVPGLVVAEGPVVDLGIVTLLAGVELVGQVMDDTGRPVARAQVALADAGPVPWEVLRTLGEIRRQAMSGDDGRFTIADLSPGVRVRLRVEKQGFLATELAALTLPAKNPLEVLLERPASLSGWVVDEAGDGIASALVGATAEQGDTRNTFSDDTGGFEIAAVSAGQWTLGASAAGYRDGRLTRLAVEPGAEVGGLEIELRPGTGLGGRVVDTDGSPAVGVTMELAGNDGQHDGRTDAGGRFRFTGLAPGRYRLSADDEGRRIERWIDIAGETTHVLLVLPTGVEVTGTVARDDGTPIAGAQALLVRAGGDGGSTRTTSDAMGRFVWSGVPDGLHHLAVQADGLAPSPLIPVAVDGASVADLEVVLDAGVTLRGRVTGVDGHDLRALVVSTADRGGGSRTSVGPEGGFVLPNLPTGEVQLTVYLTGTGRQRTALVALPAGAREVEIEIELP